MIDNIPVKKDKRQSYDVSVSEFPDTCPYCDHKVEAKFISAYQVGEISSSFERRIQLIFRCGYNQCNRIFLGSYYENDQSPGYFMLSRSGYKFYSEPLEFHEKVKTISSKFTVIYSQAKDAEDNNLKEICGCGYRRALEFLVKDYLIYKNPESKDKIAKSWLKSCIDNIDDNRIRELAKRAAWLGNDQTHYFRKYENNDIKDLKALIDLITNWIESELISEDFIKDIK